MQNKLCWATMKDGLCWADRIEAYPIVNLVASALRSNRGPRQLDNNGLDGRRGPCQIELVQWSATLLARASC